MTTSDPHMGATGATAAADEPVVTRHELSTDQPMDSSSLSELLSTLMNDVSALFRKEVELARAEVKQEASRAAKAGGMLGAAAGVAVLAAILLSFALAWLLGEFLPVWVGFLIVGAVYAIVAGVLFKQGRDRLKAINPKPEQTVETLKEDAQWAKNRAR